MKERYFKKLSRLALVGHIICTFFAVVGLFSQMANADYMAPYMSIVPIVANIVVLIIGIICNRLFGTTGKYYNILAVAYAVVYFFMMIFADNGDVFPYMIPFLIVFLLSLEKFAVVFGSVVFVIVSIIRVVLTASSTDDITTVIAQIMVQVIITVLVAAVCTFGYRHINEFFELSMDEVSHTSAKSRDMAESIVKVASTVEDSMESMNDELDQIVDSTKAVNTSMGYISEGSQNTAEAITNQTLQTQTIQDIINDTYESSTAIGSIAKETESVLEEGSAAMDKLFEQVNIAINGSKQMQDISLQLKENTEQVRGITNIILGISSQTNLLALNASIEAARAGESGRGFAVVADEIRNLAEQTRQETENITTLINALAENSDAVIDRVAENVEASEKQNEYAVTATGKFDEITERMSGLVQEIAVIEEKISSLKTANNEIVDNVSTLSAVSEEISSNTITATEMSNSNVNMLNDFYNKMKDISEQIKELSERTIED